MPAIGPLRWAGGSYTKNTRRTRHSSVFDIETNDRTTSADPAPTTSSILTFQAIAAGAANIVINDDGGGRCCGCVHQPGSRVHPGGLHPGQRESCIGVVPAPATLGLLATGLAGLALPRAQAGRLTDDR